MKPINALVKARMLIQAVTDKGLWAASGPAAEALTRATFAVAEELRTANLIAWATAFDPPESAELQRTIAEIVERLELNQ